MYQLPNGKFGIAYRKEQHQSFIKIKKVYIHVFQDRICTKPDCDPITGKKYVGLYLIEKLKLIGFID